MALSRDHDLDVRSQALDYNCTILLLTFGSGSTAAAFQALALGWRLKSFFFDAFALPLPRGLLSSNRPPPPIAHAHLRIPGTFAAGTGAIGPLFDLPPLRYDPPSSFFQPKVPNWSGSLMTFT